jgi:integrase
MADPHSTTDDMLREMTRNPPVKTTDINIPQVKGLRVRHFAGSGSISFFHLYRFDGRQRKQVLGKFRRKFGIDEAAEKLGDVKDRIAAGIDPQPKAEDAVITVADLCDNYYKQIDPAGAKQIEANLEPDYRRPGQKLTVPGPVYRILKNDIKAHIGKLKLTNVEPGDVTSLIQDKALGIGRYAKAAPAPGHTARVMSVARQLFNWGITRGHMKTHPLATFRPSDLGIETGAKDRHLDLDEVKQFWAATDDLHPTHEGALRILLLTGARGGELRRASWADIDFQANTWTIPVENQKSSHKRKNPRDFVIPLEPMAVAEFRRLQQQTGHQAMVLLNPAGEGTKAYPESELRKRTKLLVEAAGMHKFSPHDLRRTFRTGLADCKVEQHIAERAINHSLGVLDETYNRSDVLPQRRKAHAKWEKKLAVYLSDDDTVVTLERSA